MKGFSFSRTITPILLAGVMGFAAISCDLSEDETILTWDRSYTATSSTQYKPRFVFETSEGDLLSYGGQSSLDLLCTTREGDLKWSLSFSEIIVSSYQVYRVTETPDGFLVSYVNKNNSVSRAVLDKEGNKTDLPTIPIADVESIRGLDASEESLVMAVKDADGGFFFRKLSPLGESIWQHDATDFVNNVCTFVAINATRDGGAVIIGRRNDTSDDRSGCIARLDPEGKMAWTTHINPLDNMVPAVKWDSPKSIYEAEDGGFIYTAHYGIDMEYYLGSYIAKISQKGNVTTKVVFPNSYANCAKETKENGYILTGFNSSFNVPSNDVRIESMFIEKLNSLFLVQWKREYPVGETEKRERMFDVSETADGGYITTSGYPHASTYWLMKVNNKGKLNTP